jgi:non-specific serine/threonine protein kinase/serine/threonine-protein kinase
MIGEGGMGQVWLAEQKYPVRRRVAIKLIKVGMDTREVVVRFESERQALALMDHPAIAKVFDAGSTPTGRPYFAMEYVAGMPITAYCDKHRLTLRQRMELFILVCEGVQHAHQKAIIHRDLKPSNILVSEIDGKPMPRIIDFGVAKATSQKLSGGTMHTQLGAVIGTLGYMSPEQADSAGEDIDTRTDVYSLGAILYELLVSTLPLDLHQLAFDEVLRRLRDQDAPRPSTRLRTMGESSAMAAKNRGADAPTLARQLRGDPDAIALKALEKDRKRRYASASDLAEDIGRYLRDEPVTAQPPSAAYRARKYVRRHRLGVAMAGAGLLLLVGFAVAETVELRRISRERDRADRISQFMTKMFKVSNPSEARGNTVTAREILDKASSDIDAGLKDDPELQAKMMFTMAQTYEGLGLYSRAQSLLERALAIQQRVLGPRNPETLRTMSLLATSLGDEGQYTEEEKLARETSDMQRKVLGQNNPDTLQSIDTLASALDNEGRYPETEKLVRETLASRERVLGPEHADTLRSMHHLAATLMQERHYSDAEKLERQALEIRRRVLGSDHPDTLASMAWLATILNFQHKYAEAEKLQRETIDIERRVLSPEHPDTLRSMSALADTLRLEQHNTEAEKFESDTLDIQRRVLGKDNPDTLYSMSYLALILEAEGKHAEAEKVEREALAADRRVLGPDHPETLYMTSYLARTLEAEGHYADAEKSEREVQEIESHHSGGGGPDTAESLAMILSHEGRYDEAQPLFHQIVQRASSAKNSAALADAWYNFACGAAIAGRRDEALEHLGQAISLGFGHADGIASDADLKSLHGDPRFDALVAKARQDATARAQ